MGRTDTQALHLMDNSPARPNRHPLPRRLSHLHRPRARYARELAAGIRANGRCVYHTLFLGVSHPFEGPEQLLTVTGNAGISYCASRSRLLVRLSRGMCCVSRARLSWSGTRILLLCSFYLVFFIWLLIILWVFRSSIPGPWLFFFWGRWGL